MEGMNRSWIEIIIGVWVLVSPWLLGFSSIPLMKWSNLAAGTIIVLMNVWMIYGKKPEITDQEQKKK